MEAVKKVRIRETNDLCQIISGGRTGPNIIRATPIKVVAVEVDGMVHGKLIVFNWLVHRLYLFQLHQGRNWVILLVIKGLVWMNLKDFMNLNWLQVS